MSEDIFYVTVINNEGEQVSSAHFSSNEDCLEYIVSHRSGVGTIRTVQVSSIEQMLNPYKQVQQFTYYMAQQELATLKEERDIVTATETLDFIDRNLSLVQGMFKPKALKLMVELLTQKKES